MSEYEHPVERLKEVQSEELNDFFEENEGELRPWGTAEWDEKRDEIVGDTCEWCGSEDGPFHVHHTSNSPVWTREWIKATDEAFVYSSGYSSNLTEDREECPNCGLRNYYERETKSPTYRCNECGSEFESPKHVPGADVIASDEYDTKPYINDGYYEAKADWLENNPDQAREIFKERFDERMEEYMEMEDVVTICQSCHFQEEQTSNRRCSECGEKWHSYDKEMCWECLKEEKGIKQCPECGDGWYQPSKYDACSDCR